MDSYKPETAAIHAGQKPDDEHGAVIPPIYQTSTFVQREPGKLWNKDDYTRAGNPNFRMLEEVLAALENGVAATVFSSGLGAITVFLHILKPGDKLLATEDLYGGTYRLFTSFFEKYGIEVRYADLSNTELAKKEIEAFQPTLVWIESPTNPLLKLVDIKTVTQYAKEAGAKVAVDNTFATPIFQKPLDLGADYVVHSTTKYISGHSDVIGGAVVTKTKEANESFQFARMALGLNPSPFDVWLLLRSVKTLAVRMRQYQENAQVIAEFLKQHATVKQVYYPGFGGMISFEVSGNAQDAESIVKKTKLFTLAESLGGVESLISIPAKMTHASMPKEECEKRGLVDTLIRLSVGLENKEDLISDLEKSLGDV